MTRKPLKQSKNREGCRIDIEQPGAIRADEIKQLSRRCNSFIGDRGYAIEKEVYPAFPIALQPHEIETPAIFFAVTLEEKAEIEKRRLQQSPVLQQEGDHQAPNPPIAAEIGVNGFELHVQ